MSDAAHPKFLQADDYVHALIPRADWQSRGAPLWHGWAVREAWLAGYSAACDECADACEGLQPTELHDDCPLGITESMAADACRRLKGTP